jgi:putative transcriptional regulator
LLDNYNNFAQRAINNISVCTAIAETEIAKNKKVGLKMKDGLLYAVTQPGSETSAITVTSAGRGEDIGVSNIQGIIPLMIGRVSIIKIPGVERGGSRQVDYDLLKSYAASSSPIVSLGLEAYVTLQKASLPFQHFGSGEALIEATRSGLNPLAVCAEGESSLLINRLAEAKVEYRLIDAGHGTASC